MVDPWTQRGCVRERIIFEKMPNCQALADKRHLVPEIDVNKVVGNQLAKKGGATRQRGPP